MNISQSTYDKLIDILTVCFDINARSDSVAYSLDFYYYNSLGKLYHHSWAHFFPQLADIVSDEILKHNALPVRKPLNGYDYNSSDLQELFNFNLEGILDLKELMREGIEIAELNNDVEIKIFLENLLQDVEIKFEKQAYEWLNASKVLTKAEFNIHIKAYTNFIEQID